MTWENQIININMVVVSRTILVHTNNNNKVYSLLAHTHNNMLAHNRSPQTTAQNHVRWLMSRWAETDR
jgi:hypothetical protein